MNTKGANMNTKERINNQRARIIPYAVNLYKLVESLEASEDPCNRLRLAITDLRRAIDSLYPTVPTALSEKIRTDLRCFTAEEWLRLQCAFGIIAQPRMSAGQLTKQALALARKHGPSDHDGVFEFLRGDKVEYRFQEQILRMAYRDSVSPDAPSKPCQPRKSKAKVAERLGHADVIDLGERRYRTNTRRPG